MTTFLCTLLTFKSWDEISATFHIETEQGRKKKAESNWGVGWEEKD